jgi:MFS family permease
MTREAGRRVRLLDVLLGAEILAVAAFLRLHQLETLGWIPDTYERLEATKKLLAGDLPNSSLYPPGVAVLMAPFLAFMPDTLASMQVVIVAFGVLLVALGFVIGLRLTGSRLVAFLLAGLVALSPAFVYASRDALYEAISVTIMAFLLFLPPKEQHRSRLMSWLAMGALFALLVNIRSTYVFLLPALILVWHCSSESNQTSWLSRLLAGFRPVLIALVPLCVLMILSLVFVGWPDGRNTTYLSVESVPRNLLDYFSQISLGLPGVFVFLPLVVTGARQLWRLSRPMAAAACYVIIAWPVVFSPFFSSTSNRYMLPAFFVAYVLAAIGAAALVRLDVKNVWLARLGRVYAVGAPTVIALAFAVVSVSIVSQWSKTAAESDEGLFRELRPVVDGLEPGSLLVSATTRGFQGSTSKLSYVDLIDHSLTNRGGARRVDSLVAKLEAAMANGAPVYYLYTHLDGSGFVDGEDSNSLDSGIRDSFSLTVIFETQGLRLGRNRWTLYRLQPGVQPSGLEHP